MNDNDTDLDTTFAYNLDGEPSWLCEKQPVKSYAYEGLSWRKSALHCCWGTCSTDTRYPERSPPGTYLIPFPKLGRSKEGMTEWEKIESMKNKLQIRYAM